MCVNIHTSVCFCCRETMLQALRFVIQGAGSKVDPAIKKSIITTLLGMLGHDEVRLVYRTQIKFFNVVNQTLN